MGEQQSFIYYTIQELEETSSSSLIGIFDAEEPVKSKHLLLHKNGVHILRRIYVAVILDR